MESLISIMFETGSIENYRKALELRITERVEKDLARGYIKSAIRRYEGFFQYHSENQQIHYNLALLYIQIGDKKRAGRHLYLKENLSEVERECADEFAKSYGNKPIQILKILITKENFSVKLLDKSAKVILKKLVDKAVIEAGTTPNFLKGIKRHLNKIEAGDNTDRLTTNKIK